MTIYTNDGPVSRPGLPRYQQVKALILQRIQSGQLRTNDRVPSEQELVAHFGISRMTANRALRELANDGYLVRQPGVGTFVADLHAQSQIMEVRNIASEIRQRGHFHSASVVTLEVLAAPMHIARQLSLCLGQNVFHSIILHCENDQPIQVEDRYVYPQAAPEYLQQDFTRITPNEYLCEIAPLQTVEHAIRAVMPDAPRRKLLNMSAGEPGLLIRRRTWSAGRPVSIADLCHPGFRYELTANFEPLAAPPSNEE